MYVAVKGGEAAILNSYRLLAEPYHMSQAVVGVLSVVYLSGIYSSAKIGSLADRLGRRRHVARDHRHLEPQPVQRREHHRRGDRDAGVGRAPPRRARPARRPPERWRRRTAWRTG